MLVSSSEMFSPGKSEKAKLTQGSTELKNLVLVLRDCN